MSGAIHHRRWLHYGWVTKSSVAQARDTTESCSLVADCVCESSDTDRAICLRPDRDCVTVCTDPIPLAQDSSTLGLMANSRVSVNAVSRNDSSYSGESAAASWRVLLSSALSESTVATLQPVPCENPRHDGFAYCLQVARLGTCLLFLLYN